MMRILLHIWGKFPRWMHVLAAKALRPKYIVAVAALIFDDKGRILLFKHTYRKLAWGIPAGALEYGEQPEDGILREIREETGMTAKVERLLLAESSPYYHHVSLVYLCNIVSGDFKPSYEISEINYFDVNDLPRMILDEKNLIRSVHQSLWSGS
ncbi:MAG: NUDIX domain-containing protein [Anaerolineales bacterium]|nr:NUDIX domain-containing protein [Anaerolineales bacterium]